ncbi:uncharacterized protein MAM_02838 [Metarhizium album ARSEF 1941]|uniref:Uncharacterized protein n=1 Tax=Metarhizium album (strain ARSEF 1941) TaxID=1081103 RepID=A0A0B2X1X1_METAS|nr:uncharacterized protein MAM_02838 [Metarhizium album ARSEF 1941]KHN99140.1 hypothetical protein MAM_02838 [Metarhizium album ARSEF 1941]
MDATAPASDVEAVAVNKFKQRISTIFKSKATIEFPGASLKVTADKSCILRWKTRQDDSCPGHIMEWDDTSPDYIKVTSFQYPKTIPPRNSESRRAVCFKIPVRKDCGMRRVMSLTMTDLVADGVLRDKAGIKSVELIQKTPQKAIWHLVRVEEKQG